MKVIHQRTAVKKLTDNSVEVIPFANIEHRLESDNSLAQLYTDRTGTLGAVGTVTADENGYFAVYVDPNVRYKITTTAPSYSGIERNVIFHPEESVSSPDTLAALKATPVSMGAVYVQGRTSQQDGYQGNFNVVYGDYSSQIAADTQEGQYVPINGVPTTTAVRIRDRVRYEAANALHYGVKGDGVTNDTAAMQALFNSGQKKIYFPAGVGAYRHGAVTVPAGVKVIFGDDDLTRFQGIGSMADYVPFWYFDQADGIKVKDLSLYYDKVLYPNNHSLNFGSCDDATVKDLYILDSGFIAIYATASNNFSVDTLIINSFKTSAVRVEGGSLGARILKVKTKTAGDSHSIQVIGGSRHSVSRADINLTGPTTFGINYFGVENSSITDSEVTTGTLEGINLQDSSRCTINNARVYCLAGHADFGISIFADAATASHNLITASRVYFSGKSAFALASNGVFACKQNHVIGNLSVSPNQLNESMGAGVIIYGSTACSENTVQANRLIDESGKTRYGVNEWNDGGGNPQYNHLIDNPVLTATALVRQNNILTTLSEVWDLKKENFTTTVTSTTGTLTTASGTVSYKRRGKFMDTVVSVTITTNGTGATSINVTMPFTLVGGSLNGIENTISGAQCVGIISGANIVIKKYDNTYPGANGATFQLSGTLEIA